MPLFLTARWRKLLLAAGLLLVLASGLVQLPEIGSRLSPNSFWSEHLFWAQKSVIRAEMRLELVDATLEALAGAEKQGLPHLQEGRLPTAAGFAAAWRRTQALRQRCWEDAQEVQEVRQQLQSLREDLGKK